MAKIKGTEFEGILSAKDNTKAAYTSATQNAKAYASTNKKHAEKTKTVWNKSLQDISVKAVVAFKAVQVAITQAQQYLQKWADLSAQMQAMDALAKRYDTSALSIVANLQKVTDGMLSMKQATEIAVLGLNSGLDPSTLERYAASARNLAALTGKDVPTAFAILLDAVQKGSVEGLASVGIFIDVNKVYREYAENIGISANQLSIAQKLEARRNEILKITEHQFGAIGKELMTLSDRLTTLSAWWEDFQAFLGAAMGYIIQMIETTGYIVAAEVASINASLMGAMGTIEQVVLQHVSYLMQAVKKLPLLPNEWVHAIHNFQGEIGKSIEISEAATEALVSDAETFSNKMMVEAGKRNVGFKEYYKNQITAHHTTNAAFTDTENSKTEKFKSALSERLNAFLAIQAEYDAIEQTAKEKEMTEEELIKEKVEINHQRRLETLNKYYEIKIGLAETDAERTALLEEQSWALAEASIWKKIELDNALYDNKKRLEEEKQLKEAEYEALMNLKNEEAIEKDLLDWEIEYNNLVERNEIKRAAIEEYYAYLDSLETSQAEKEKIASEKSIALKELEAEKKKNIEKIYNQAMYETAMGTLAMLAKENKQAFELYKIAQIAETVINTYKAAVGAYAAMASIPYVGPALGALAAAAAVTFGLAQVQQIKNQKMHSGGLVQGNEREPTRTLELGEYVMSKKGVNLLNRINTGSISGMGGAQVTYNINTFDSQSFNEYLQANSQATVEIHNSFSRYGGV